MNVQSGSDCLAEIGVDREQRRVIALNPFLHNQRFRIVANLIVDVPSAFSDGIRINFWRLLSSHRGNLTPVSRIAGKRISAEAAITSDSVFNKNERGIAR